jgi:uncharacterized protein YjiS (DUF1127 family)
MGTIRLDARGLAADWASWILIRATTVAMAALGLLLTWYLRRQQRFDLAALDDRGLRDVGLSRAEVAREVDKPFWR